MIKQEFEWFNVDEKLPPVGQEVLGAWYEYKKWNYLVVARGKYSDNTSPSKQFDSVVDAGAFPPIEYWAYLKPFMVSK